MPVFRSARRGQYATCAAALAAVLLGACGGALPEPVSARAAAPAAHPSGARPLTPRPTPAPPVAAPRPPASGRQPAGRDIIDVDKCWTNATATSGGQLLVSASSSDQSARLLAYRADGTLIGEVQNGRGQRYGGTVFPWQATDPGAVTIRSSSGGSITVRTTPWRAEN